jgi:hypothetical protein
MDDMSRSPQSPAWWLTLPWRMMSALAGSGGAGLTPRSLDQPILPGWVFANSVSVTSENSSAPDTERDIVAQQSYGRQLGRLMDGVAELIAERPAGAPTPPAIEDFEDLHAEVLRIKAEAAARRLERAVEDLATLRRADADAYQRMARELRAALDREPDA